MQVPKWLIPVISVVAALAVGVALAFVGANFAPSQTVDKTAKTTVVPVLAPVASGLSQADTQKLFASHKAGKSQVIGQETVSEPLSKPSTSAFRLAVQQAADGTGSSSTPSPEPSSPTGAEPNPAPASPAGSTGTSNDSCAPVDQKIPMGCPGGLRSRIYGLLEPPALDFTMQPFTAPCPTSPTPLVRNPDAVNIYVLLQPTKPSTFTFNVIEHNDGHDLVSGQLLNFEPVVPEVSTTPEAQSAWQAALATASSTADLPQLATCVTIPDKWQNNTEVVDVTATTASGESVDHELWMSAGGAVAPGPVRITTVGPTDFIATGDMPPDQQMDVRAYTVSGLSHASCNSVAGLTRVEPVYANDPGRGGDPLYYHEPADYTNAESDGFQVASGSSTLVCAKWFHAGSSPSWDRTTAIRTSSVVVQSPDVTVPHAFVIGFANQDDAIASITDSRVASITISGTSADGIPCGSAVVWRDGHATFDDAHFGSVTVCLPSPSAGVQFGETGVYRGEQPPISGDIVLTTTVVSTTGESTSSTYTLNTGEVVCVGCLDNRTQVDYNVPLPGVRSGGTTTGSVGTAAVIADWPRVGNGGLRDWLVTPVPEYDVVPPDPSSGPPQLDTDHGLFVDHTTASPLSVTAGLYVLASQDADYTVALQGSGGVPACTVDHASATVTGHVTVAPTPTLVRIPNLCYGSDYFARVTLTNAQGSTSYGVGSPGSTWLGYFLHTPDLHVNVSYTTEFRTPTGDVLTDLDSHINGTELDPSSLVVGGCVTGSVASSGVTPVQLGQSAVLRVHVRLRTAAPGSRCMALATDTHPAVDSDVTLDVASIMGNPAGVRITVGDYAVLLKITLAS